VLTVYLDMHMYIGSRVLPVCWLFHVSHSLTQIPFIPAFSWDTQDERRQALM
jgi:hypothetical protein